MGAWQDLEGKLGTMHKPGSTWRSDAWPDIPKPSVPRAAASPLRPGYTRSGGSGSSGAGFEITFKHVVIGLVALHVTATLFCLAISRSVQVASPAPPRTSLPVNHATLLYHRIAYHHIIHHRRIRHRG